MAKKFFIQARSGARFDPRTGEIDAIEIDDIAHALSHICRYAGHTPSMYSVAEHSVLVSRIIRKLYPDDITARWAGLLHDATEAYVCDLPTPLKVLLPQFIEIENALAQRIAEEFEIQATSETHKIVKQADHLALATEARLLFENTDTWDTIRETMSMPELLSPAFPMSSAQAKQEFLDEFKKIQSELNIRAAAIESDRP